MKKNADLPFASSLCGSCTNVCPVKIDIHSQLWKWRQVLMKKGYGGTGKKAAITMMSLILSHPFLYRISGKVSRTVMRFFPGIIKLKRFNPWYQQREMPEPPAKSFREWYKNKKS
jgi:L-lactate dehydrogenase complex protein LldF